MMTQKMFKFQSHRRSAFIENFDRAAVRFFFALQTVRCSAARASNFTKLSSMRLVRAAHAM
jgi:hypothetical protein